MNWATLRRTIRWWLKLIPFVPPGKTLTSRAQVDTSRSRPLRYVEPYHPPVYRYPYRGVEYVWEIHPDIGPIPLRQRRETDPISQRGFYDAVEAWYRLSVPAREQYRVHGADHEE